MRSEERGTRQERSDKKMRVNCPLSKTVHNALDTLAVGIGHSKTGTGALLIELALQDEKIVNKIQDMFMEESRFRIIHNSNLRFTFVERIRR